MSMFLVNRYEDHPEKEIDEEKNLQKLLKKVEKRKKAREAAKLKKVVESHLPKEKLQIQEDVNKNTKSLEITELEINSRTEISEKPKNTQSITGFTIIGSDSFERKQKAKRVLPYWLSHPTKLSTDLHNSVTPIVDVIDLDAALRSELEKSGVNSLFPVQAAVVPFLLEENRKRRWIRPRDVCVSAPTGSGKTLAFVLPIVQILKNRFTRQIRALIVLPVQELAAQVFSVFNQYSKIFDLKVVLLSGATSFSVEQSKLIHGTYYTVSPAGSQNEYSCEADIVVATPGRLVEHIHNTPGLSMKQLRFLVVDEADRVMDNIQNDWLWHLEKFVGSGLTNIATNLISLKSKSTYVQKLLFSATLSTDPEKLEKLHLFQPKMFTTAVEQEETVDDKNTIGKYITPKEVTEQYIVCSPDMKPLALYRLMIAANMKRVLCFTSSALAVHRLCLLMRSIGGETLKAAELSSAVSSSTRDKVLKQFTDSEIDILISSDALARGIDVPDVDYVISYDAPKYIKNYIHRIGRTGRAGKTGTAVTMITQAQKSKFLNMVQHIDKSIEEIHVNENEFDEHLEAYKKALEVLKEQLQKENSEKAKKSKKEKIPVSKRKRKAKSDVNGNSENKNKKIKIN